jgi:tetratricopeptide (TPR) repeat protein/predicted Ser/Thr protein kinase
MTDSTDTDSPLGDAPAMLESLAARHRRDEIRARLFQTDASPALIGRYEVLRKLGAGAIGVVYVCRDPRLDRDVAVKVLRDPTADTARLRREAQAMARLSDPNVAAIYEVGMHDARVYVAMELVDGVTLREWQRGRSPSDVLAAYAQAGRGLAAAHRVGIVHRDFKPDNAMIGRDARVRVLDFGLARGSAADEDAPTLPPFDALAIDETGSGTTLGTPAYMPPEQLRSANVDARADQFAFCVALYEALHGERPFGGASVRDLTHAILAGHVRAAKPDVPTRVRAVLVRGLASDPDRRFVDMDALLAALAGAQRPRRYAVPVAVGLAGLAAVLVLQPSASDECAKGEAAIADLWNPSIARATRSELRRSGVPESIWGARIASIDTRAGEWREEARALCSGPNGDNHEDNHEDTDDRRACLDDVRKVLAADLEAVRRDAASAPASALSIATCRELRARGGVPVTATAEHAAMAHAIRDSISAAVDAGSAGDYPTARAEIEPAIARARAIDEPVLLSEALLISAATHHAVGDYPAAERQEIEAYDLALAVGHDRLALRASAALIDTVGYALRRADDGERWARNGEALLGHVAPDDPVIGRFLVNRGLMRIEHDALDEARADLEHARRLVVEADGPDAAEQQPILGNLAHIAMMRGELATAQDLMDRSVALVERHEGAQHPEMVSVLSNRSVVATTRGLYDEALIDLQHALAIAELRDLEHERAFVHNNFAEVYFEQGRFAEARKAAELGIAGLSGLLAADHPRFMQAQVRLARILVRDGDPARARALLQAILARAEASLGVDHRDVAEARIELAGVELQAGEVTTAERELARAMPLSGGLRARCTVMLAHAHEAEVLRASDRGTEAEAPLRAAIAQAYGCSGTTLAQAELALARLLAATGRVDDECHALAASARDRWRERGHGWEAHARAVDRWLAGLDAKPRAEWHAR